MTSPSIAIVTDSTADIPDAILDKYGIHLVNNFVVIDGQSLEDRKEIGREQFYTALPTMKSVPTTATAPPGVYQSLYQRLLSEGKDLILSIHASGKLSGILNAAASAAQYFRNRVRVIDSFNISMGLGFQVIAAAEAAQAGASLETILNLLDDVRNRTRVVAMLDTLEYIRRSGRVSWAKARLGDLLRIKPFVEVMNGQVWSLGEVRTYHKGFIRLVELLQKICPIERLAVLHTNAENQARQFLEEITDFVPDQTFLVNVTTVIGSHTGPNGLGFAAVLKQSPVDW
jgi:DegV family protein with EDD domain